MGITIPTFNDGMRQQAHDVSGTHGKGETVADTILQNILTILAMAAGLLFFRRRRRRMAGVY